MYYITAKGLFCFLEWATYLVVSFTISDSNCHNLSLLNPHTVDMNWNFWTRTVTVCTIKWSFYRSYVTIINSVIGRVSFQKHTHEIVSWLQWNHPNKYVMFKRIDLIVMNMAHCPDEYSYSALSIFSVLLLSLSSDSPEIRTVKKTSSRYVI